MSQRTRKPASPGLDRSDTAGGPNIDPIRWAVEVLKSPTADPARRTRAVRAAARYIAAQPARDRPALLARLGRRR